MKHILVLLWLLSVLLSFAPVLSAAEKVTEEYVVNVLNGNRKEVIAKKAPGFVFGVTFFPPNDIPPRGSTNRADGEKVKNEEFYRKLIPLGRALESEILQGYRFLITVKPIASMPADHGGVSSLQIAEEIKHFLTTYFAIVSERLHIQGRDDPTPITAHGADATGTRRWKVEVERLE